MKTKPTLVCDICDTVLDSLQRERGFKIKQKFCFRSEFALFLKWKTIDLCPRCEKTIIDICKKASQSG